MTYQGTKLYLNFLTSKLVLDCIYLKKKNPHRISNNTVSVSMSIFNSIHTLIHTYFHTNLF
jgi:hypothetical protein